MTQTSSHQPAGAAPVLVLAAGGTVAGATLDELRRRDVAVRALVRRPRPADDPGIEWVVGDLRDPGVLTAALRGVRTVLYVTPHENDETAMADLVVRATRAAGVRLVFVGVHVSTRTVRGWLLHHVFRLLLPAYVPKLKIGRMVERTLPDAALVVPSNFYDNDLTFLADIEAGEYPTPIRRVNRVAVSDIAQVCADALTDPAFPAGTHGVSGPASLSGEESAAAWAEALGRPVRYVGNDPEAWEAALCRRIPEGKRRRDWRNSFRALGRMSMKTSPRDVEETTRLLGRPPLDYRSWVAAQVRSRAEVGS